VLLAFTRAVPPSIGRCELTYIAREPIDYARAVQEHAAYEACLRALGCEVRRLPDAPDLPDSVFVEDTAIVFDDLAVITRPGAASRRPELDAMAAALGPHRRLAFIESPGTLDGGDVLVTPGRVFVGISGRTNPDGVRQLATHLAPLGLDVLPVPVSGCLHLKSAVTLAGHRPGARGSQGATSDTILVINPAWVDPAVFAGLALIEVDPQEPAAANVLRIADRLVCAEAHPRTRQRLEAYGLPTVAVPAAELAKAEGGVTCCSVMLTRRG